MLSWYIDIVQIQSNDATLNMSINHAHMWPLASGGD